MAVCLVAFPVNHVYTMLNLMLILKKTVVRYGKIVSENRQKLRKVINRVRRNNSVDVISKTSMQRA